MIDYISLALGHALLAFAFLRLVLRADLDVDPEIQGFKDQADAVRNQGNGRRNKRADESDQRAIGSRRR